MKELVEAVADSIVKEVDGADAWVVHKFDPLWRKTKDGQVLNVYPGRALPGPPLWSEGAGLVDVYEIVVEYGEPAPQQKTKLERDEEAELEADAIADSLRRWGLQHPRGFAPAWRMEWVGTDYVPNVRRLLLFRYCRLTFRFEVVNPIA